MSETKWTPGPWRYWETVGGYRIAGKPKDLKASKCWVADVTYPEKEVDPEANARLIAAAPDLYEALEAASKALEAIASEMTVGERYSNAGQYLLDALEPVRAALAKARGE